jgi:CBS domain-containing protein
MGTLLSDGRNVTYSSAGTLSPLLNDPYFETIGIGTRIFLCGGEGYIVSSGTQHSTECERHKGIPKDSAGTLMVQGDMKQMDSDYVKGVIMHNYGPTIFNGIGIPIPILNKDIAARTAISDEDIVCKIYDYGVSRRNKPVLGETNYKELRSGKIEINGKEIPTSSLSSYKKAKKIADELKNWIENKEFLLTNPVKKLANNGYKPKPLNTKPVTLAKDFINKEIIKIKDDTKLSTVAKELLNHEINHLPVINEKDELIGIVTSWDIAKAVAKDETDLYNVMTRRVISVKESDTIEDVVRLLDVNHISGVPIINNKNEVTGIITTEDINRLKSKESSN